MEVLEIMEKVKIENARRKCKKYFALNSKIYVKEIGGGKKDIVEVEVIMKTMESWRLEGSPEAWLVIELDERTN